MEISEIKRRLQIQTVLNHYNLQPTRHNFLKCPFHGDEGPSLKIYPETNTFNCFGCGAAGDVSPRKWLTDVLTHILYYNNDYDLDLADLLPHNWKAVGKLQNAPLEIQ